MRSHQKEFIEMILAKQVLRFGDFTLKSGRTSPYFFNAGLINDGGSLARLGAGYAEAILEAGTAFDMLFGPAYKGIPLATATAVAFAQNHRRNVPLAYNRKEAKAHGEGGTLVGAPLEGRVLIVDDVLTAGTAVRESIGLIKAAGATPAGVVLALDRQERGQGRLSAVQEIQAAYKIPVIRIITLGHLVEYLAAGGDSEELEALRNHLRTWGVEGES
ncbi:MAG TPA: orotate phosphoribosyltransferase [Steroidobacteraceae bacterium]|nr:orotate phosphoribosyltransferase [Steroidobacteraceae bacterium]